MSERHEIQSILTTWKDKLPQVCNWKSCIEITTAFEIFPKLWIILSEENVNVITTYKQHNVHMMARRNKQPIGDMNIPFQANIIKQKLSLIIHWLMLRNCMYKFGKQLFQYQFTWLEPLSSNWFLNAQGFTY